LWDIRARKTVYELATGNNNVVKLAWDKSRAMLYAASVCQYVDRDGYHFDYRRARIPKLRAKVDGDGHMDEANEMGESGKEESEESEMSDEEKNWPQEAFHSEDYFGYTFDAGEHRICESLKASICTLSNKVIHLDRYAFKANADPNIVPAYGYASLADPYTW
jgi:hypothetical protein